MAHKIHLNDDKGLSGYFLQHPAGCFTIHSGGGFVIGDLCSETGCDSINTDEVAHSALIQDF